MSKFSYLDAKNQMHINFIYASKSNNNLDSFKKHKKWKQVHRMLLFVDTLKETSLFNKKYEINNFIYKTTWNEELYCLDSMK